MDARTPLTIRGLAAGLPEAIRGHSGHPLLMAVKRHPAAFVVVLVLARAFLDGLGYQHPDDPVLLSDAGLKLLRGDISSVYADERVQVGPLGLLIYGFAGLLHELGLGLIMMLSVIASATYGAALWFCVKALGSSGEGVRRASAAVVVAVLAGLSWTAATSGHSTEGLVALLWVYAAFQIQKGRADRAGIALGIAVAIKLFAVLGLPMLLLFPSFRRQLQGFLSALLVSLIFWLPFFLAGPTNMFGFVWEIKPHAPLALLFEPLTEFTWQLRVLQAGVICGFGALAAYASRRQRFSFLSVPLVLMGLRLLTDPLGYHYYILGPGSILLVGWALTIGSEVRASWLALPALYYAALIPFFLWGGVLLASWIILLSVALLATPAVSRLQVAPDQGQLR